MVGAAATALARTPSLFGNSAGGATQRLGQLLSGFGTTGIAPTLRALGLEDVVGLTGDDLLAQLVDYVSGENTTLEDAAIRTATERALAELLEDEQFLSSETIDEEAAARVLERFFAGYIAELVLAALSSRFVNAATPEEATRLEQQVRDYVTESLANLLDGRSVLQIDWAGAEGLRIANQVRDEALDVFSE